MHRQWWNDLPVRWQLMISISIISVSAVLLSVALAVYDARGRVEVEVNASMELSRQLVNDLVKRLAADKHIDDLRKVMPEQLKYVRHSRILITDEQGDLVQIAPDEQVERHLFERPERARSGSPIWSDRASARARSG